MRRLRLVAVVILLSAGSSAAEEYRAIFWNLQSGNSSDSLLAAQMIAKGDIDFWGLSEVQDQDAVDTFEEALENANPGVDFIAKISEEGGGDQLAIIYRADRMTAVAYSGNATVDDIGDNFFEVDSINVGGTIRPALGVQFESPNGDRVVVLVNHWKCCGDNSSLERRKQQAIQMNAFAVSTPGIPIVAGGDFNIPLIDNASTQEAFQELTQLWDLEEPQPNVGSWRGGSVLDAVLTTNDVPEWEATVTILEREGNTEATTSSFSDNSSSTDHRPLRVVVHSDTSERLEGLREAIADMRAALERMEAELARLEAANP